MQGLGCQSCDNCPMTHDVTAGMGGRLPCEPGTNTYYIDDDLDGTIDQVGQFLGCSYEDCVSCNIETSGDLTSSPSGTTNHGAGNGSCRSGLDHHVGCAASLVDCSEMCV